MTDQAQPRGLAKWGAIAEAIDSAAGSVGFSVEGQTVEVVGLCSNCRNAA